MAAVYDRNENHHGLIHRQQHTDVCIGVLRLVDLVLTIDPLHMRIQWIIDDFVQEMLAAIFKIHTQCLPLCILEQSLKTTTTN